MKQFLFIILLLSVFSCSNDDNEILSSFENCDKQFENYKSYEGEKITCQFYYYLTNFDNQEFLELHSRCADLTRPYVYDENCIDICAEDPYSEDSPCGKYLLGRELVEIALIEK